MWWRTWKLQSNKPSPFSSNKPASFRLCPHFYAGAIHSRSDGTRKIANLYGSRDARCQSLSLELCYVTQLFIGSEVTRECYRKYFQSTPPLTMTKPNQHQLTRHGRRGRGGGVDGFERPSPKWGHLTCTLEMLTVRSTRCYCKFTYKENDPPPPPFLKAAYTSGPLGTIFFFLFLFLYAKKTK